MKLYTLAAALTTAEAFTFTNHNGAQIHSTLVHNQNTRCATKLGMADEIISPFDNNSEDDSGDGGVSTATFTPLPSDDEQLDLTWENVDLVLEEMRPYLIQDGGNVAISEIDGPIVRLELQGACGTCPSSTQTMKMGLERKLLERIPEIQEVIQAMPDSPDLNEEQINTVLDSVRPFLQVAGGTIDVDSITGEGGLQPTITLKMEGSAASLNSVKLEIAQRLQRHFMISGMRVEWA
jgi:Fe-S cluster biogenesis protein NfuA